MIGNIGYVGLTNGTPYTWRRTFVHSYQMTIWDSSFPETILPGHVHRGSVEFNTDWEIDSTDDKGEVIYSLDIGGISAIGFMIQATNLSGFNILAKTNNIPTKNRSQRDGVIELGWRPNGTVNFILSGEVGNFSTNNPPIDWMQSCLSFIGDRTLRQICIPGSHDAGISTRNGGTPLANANNTKTQSLSIAGQLIAGVRYLDIRPVIGNGGQWYTGHYGYTRSRVGWQGWNGQSLSEIVHQINAFLSFHKELVILDVSHGYNTDEGYRDLNDSEWHRCFDVLSEIKHLYFTTTFDLTQLTINDFIGGERAAVIVISRGTWNLGIYRMKGFYNSYAYAVYDRYANDVHPDAVIQDQLSKMQTWQNDSPHANLFLLAWTASQKSLWDVLTTNIRDSALKLNPRIYQELLPACTKMAYPNIISMDYVENSDITALAIAITSLLKNVW